MTTMKIIKANKKKITDHHHGCCNCGGTPTHETTDGQKQDPSRPVTPEVIGSRGAAIKRA